MLHCAAVRTVCYSMVCIEIIIYHERQKCWFSLQQRVQGVSYLDIIKVIRNKHIVHSINFVVIFYKHSINQKISKHRSTHYWNVSTDPLGTGSGSHDIRRAHFLNHWITWMQNNPSWKTNSSSSNQEPTNGPIIWEQRTCCNVVVVACA